jgi:hypothetical protein
MAHARQPVSRHPTRCAWWSPGARAVRPTRCRHAGAAAWRTVPGLAGWRIGLRSEPAGDRRRGAHSTPATGAICAVEVPADQRAPVLQAYLSKRALSKSPTSAARGYFGVDAHPSLEALSNIAEHYPVSESSIVARVHPAACQAQTRTPERSRSWVASRPRRHPEGRT